MLRFLQQFLPDRSYRPLLWIDIAFSTVLLAIAAIPLIVLRYTDWFNNAPLVFGLVAVWIAVCAGWVITAHRTRHRLNIPSETMPGYFSGSPRPFLEIVLVSGSFLIFSIVAFYIPMRQNYWIGMDEPVLIDAQRYLWYDFYDQQAGRPMASLGSFIAGNLTPGSLEGYLWFSLISRWLSALFIYMGLKVLMQRGNGLPFIIGALYLVNPSEQLRFATIFMNSFYGGMIVTTATMLAFILSYRSGKRWLLAVACVLCGMSLLHYEAAFFPMLYLLIVIPIMGWRQYAWTWLYAWLGVMTLCALRFLLFFKLFTYQSGYVNVIREDFSLKVLLLNLRRLFMPLFNFITSIDSVPKFGLYGLIALLIIAPTLWIVTKRANFTPSRRSYLIGIGIGLVTVLMSIAPWVVIPIPNVPDLANNPTLRYEFIAAVPQAIIWALVIGLTGTFLARRWQRQWAVFATGVLILFSVADAYDLQAQRGVWNPSVDFETVSHIFQQAHDLMPPLQDDSVIFFALEDNTPSPFGWTYNVHHMTCLFFGVPGYQGMISTVPSYWVRGMTGYAPPADNYLSYALNEDVVFFRVASNGDVTLEDTPDLPPAPDGSISPTPCLIPKAETEASEPLPYLLDN